MECQSLVSVHKSARSVSEALQPGVVCLEVNLPLFELELLVDQ